MRLEQILRLIVIAIVLMVAFALLAFLLAVVLRFIDLLRGKQA